MDQANWNLAAELREGWGGFCLYHHPPSGSWALATKDNPPWRGGELSLDTSKSMEITFARFGTGLGKSKELVVTTPLQPQGSTLLTVASAKLVSELTGMGVVVDEDAQDYVGAILDMLVVDDCGCQDPECSRCGA